MTDLISVKKTMKAKRPRFRRQEAFKSKRLPDNWRRAKGHHSKVRIRRSWKPKRPEAGMRTPVSLRGFDREGRKIILIKSVKDAEKLVKNFVYVISRTLGLKSKGIIAQKVLNKGFIFKNFNPEKIMEKIASIKQKKKEEPKKAVEKPKKKEVKK